MIISATNYTRKKKRQTEPSDRWLKQSYTDKITQRSIHIHTHKKRKRRKICISLLPKSTASVLGWFIVYLVIPEMLGT